MVTVQSVPSQLQPGQMVVVQGKGKLGDRVAYVRKDGSRIVASIE